MSLKGKYDGNLVYAYAKRGQVLLAEVWAKEYPDIKVVSSHPGWTLTEAVDAAYGDSKKYLEPLRTPWEGAEGIAWLLACPFNSIESGAFYLDRVSQVKHVAGPFFTEGSFTKNSEAEVAEMMKQLQTWTSSAKPSVATLQEFNEATNATLVPTKGQPAKASETQIDVQKFMGKWYVIAHIPTFVDKGTANNTEDYVWDAEKEQVNVKFSYSNLKLTKTSTLGQTAKVMDDVGTTWSISVGFGFIRTNFPYLIHDCAEDYSTCMVGEPKRSFLYIMARTPSIDDELLTQLKTKAVKMGYKNDLIVKVPQSWQS